MNGAERKGALGETCKSFLCGETTATCRCLLNVIIISYIFNKVLTTIRYALTRETGFRMDGQTGHAGVTWRLIYSDFVPT